jgi:cytochrome d ubiquinol oxidase subunit II
VKAVHATWFILLAVMLVAYAVLDGFDFGAGILHLFVAKNADERRTILAAIGPLWDGNEVWLIAASGVLVYAFPRAYAAAFSGLYLPLMMVLWLLVLRGLSIELRSKLDHPLWREGWDAVFAVASTVLALVLGVALGNVVRGVPLGADGYFHEDLFGGPPGEPGAIDAYTSVVGVFALATLAAHGATFLVWKTTGPLQERSRAAARRAWIVAGVLAVITMAVMAVWQTSFLARFVARPWLWPLLLVNIASLVVVRRSLHARRDLRAFLASCAFIASMLLATAGSLYPTILRSTLDPAYTIDVYGAVASTHHLAAGLGFWIPAMVLAVGYFVLLYRSHRGKARADEHGH